MNRTRLNYLPTLFRGGRIARLSPIGLPYRPALASAIVTLNGQIAAMGQEEDLKPLLGSEYRVVDVTGLTLAPGFNDAHMHIALYGLDLFRADLSVGAGVNCAADAVATLQQWHRSNPTSEWILGVGLRTDNGSGCEHLCKAELDLAFPDQPVSIQHATRHGVVVNSAALRKAGIGWGTPDPVGGTIVRDIEGNPNGMLLESAADMVASVMPLPTVSELKEGIMLAARELSRRGVTSASGLKTGWFSMTREIEAYQNANAAGIPLRMTLSPHAPDFVTPEMIPDFVGFRASFRSANNSRGNLRFGPLKMFADGALTIRTAAVSSPYADGSGLGSALYDSQELSAWVVAAHKRGWQIAIHAIGDRASEMVIDAYSAAQRAFPRRRTRHRIEHAMMVDPELIKRMALLDVVAVMQPEFLHQFGDEYMRALGDERASHLMPVASLAAAGVPVAFSSDCPVIPGLPLEGIRAAVERRTASGRPLGTHEAVAREQALYYYTAGAAFATFDEHHTGLIRTGMRADFVALRGWDDEGADIEVAATIFEGEVVYGDVGVSASR